MNTLEYIKKIRRHLHQNPEVGFETHNTIKYIKDHLTDLGLTSNLFLNDSALICKINLNKEKTIAFRADIDALCIKELNDIPFKSKNDYMHACGHDAHTAILMGFAKMVCENKDAINVNIVLIFQPAEEGPLPGGAIGLIDLDILKDVRAFFAFHVTNKLKSNTIGLKGGEAFAAPDLFDGVIIGKACHAAAPNDGINPIMVASSIAQDFESFYNDLKTNEEIIVTTTYINTSTTKNAIASNAIIGGTARSFSDKNRKLLKKRLSEIFYANIKKYKASGDFNFHFAYDPLYNNLELINLINNVAPNIIPTGNIIRLTDKEFVGEDFSYYKKIAPICLIWLGVNNTCEYIPLHSPFFNLDEDSLLLGSKLFFNIALYYK